MAKAAGLLTLAAIFALFLGEAIVRVAGDVLHRLPVVANDETLGWTGWPNLRRAEKDYAGGSFRLSSDSLGHRLAYPPGHTAGNAPVLLLVGDSFTQGVGVDDEETLAWRVARAMPEHEVVDLGVAGYGSDQELLSVEKFFRTNTAPVSDIVVVAYENDFRDVQASFDYALARSKPRFHLRGQEIEREPYRQSFLDRIMDDSRLVWLARTKVMYRFRPAKLAPEPGVDLVVACIDAIRRLGREHNARVHVFAYQQAGPPLGFTSEVPDSTWASFIKKSGAIDMTNAIRTGTGPNPIGFDRLHWSPEGTRRAARVILDSLQAAPPA